MKLFNNARKSTGATLALTAIFSLLFIIFGLFVLFGTRLLSGSCQLNNATSAGVLSAAKEAAVVPEVAILDSSLPNADSLPYGDFWLLGDRTVLPTNIDASSIVQNGQLVSTSLPVLADLLVYNRLVGQALIVASNAAYIGTPQAQKDAQLVAQAVQNIGQALRNKQAGAYDQYFDKLADANTLNMLGIEPDLARTGSLQAAWDKGPSNVWLDESVLAGSQSNNTNNGIPFDTQQYAPVPNISADADFPATETPAFISGYMPISLLNGTVTLDAVSVGPLADPHAIDESRFDASTAPDSFVPANAFKAVAQATPNFNGKGAVSSSGTESTGTGAQTPSPPPTSTTPNGQTVITPGEGKGGNSSTGTANIFAIASAVVGTGNSIFPAEVAAGVVQVRNGPSLPPPDTYMFDGSNMLMNIEGAGKVFCTPYYATDSANPTLSGITDSIIVAANAELAAAQTAAFNAQTALTAAQAAQISAQNAYNAVQAGPAALQMIVNADQNTANAANNKLNADQASYNADSTSVTSQAAAYQGYLKLLAEGNASAKAKQWAADYQALIATTSALVGTIHSDAAAVTYANNALTTAQNNLNTANSAGSNLATANKNLLAAQAANAAAQAALAAAQTAAAPNQSFLFSLRGFGTLQLWRSWARTIHLLGQGAAYANPETITMGKGANAPILVADLSKDPLNYWTSANSGLFAAIQSSKDGFKVKPSPGVLAFIPAAANNGEVAYKIATAADIINMTQLNSTVLDPSDNLPVPSNPTFQYDVTNYYPGTDAAGNVISKIGKDPYDPVKDLEAIIQDFMGFSDLQWSNLTSYPNFVKKIYDQKAGTTTVTDLISLSDTDTDTAFTVEPDVVNSLLADMSAAIGRNSANLAVNSVIGTSPWHYLKRALEHQMKELKAGGKIQLPVIHDVSGYHVYGAWEYVFNPWEPSTNQPRHLPEAANAANGKALPAVENVGTIAQYLYNIVQIKHQNNAIDITTDPDFANLVENDLLRVFRQMNPNITITQVYNALGFNASNIHSTDPSQLFNPNAPLLPPGGYLNIHVDPNSTPTSPNLIADPDTAQVWASANATPDSNSNEATLDTGYFKVCGSTGPKDCANNDWIDTTGLNGQPSDNNYHDAGYYAVDNAYVRALAGLQLSSGYHNLLGVVNISSYLAPDAAGGSTIIGSTWWWNFHKPN